jgi:primosomal protein N' (replication factor Y)
MAMCPRCLIPYTLHSDLHRLQCHVCGLRARVPTSCPECHSADILHKGVGTKLIESELRKLYPNQRIARYDGDTASDETLERQYQELYDGTISIIIGTQVVAKGLDLPLLRTVGVIQADAGLALPDFAASERTFQLLAQVMGRVGRAEHETNVIVQTYQPDAAAIRLGIAQDYNTFYEATLVERRRAQFPPFTYLLKLTCSYKTEAAAIRNAQQLASRIRQKYPSVSVLGPTPAFYERQRDTYRWQLVIKSRSRSTLTDICADLPGPRWQFDLDPYSLL